MAEQKTRVLVIDDNEVKRYTITHTLRSAGFAVLEGASAADALRLALQATLVVLDVKMPDLDGFEVCRQLKANPATAHVPVLLLSATFIGTESQVKGLESGADAYLTDATEPPVLVATVRALIRMRQAEEEARRGEARLRLALEAGRLGDWELNLDTQEMTCSAQCRAIFGLASDARFTFADLQTATHPDDRAVMNATLQRAIAEGTSYDAEYRITSPTGEIRWVLARGHVTRGLHRLLIGVFLDVTERKRTEEALREADRQKDEFLALLAHELRNPLAPLRTALAIQQQPGVDASALARSRETMARQLGSMVRLIDDLLDVSRISKGKVELRRSRVELASVISAATETSRPLIEAGQHELTVELSNEPIWLDADPTRLAQVVANLLNNAAKYTPESGRIRLSAALRKVERGATNDEPKKERNPASSFSEVEIRVADNGAGIAPELLPRMWEMFAQADRTLGRAQGGLGIGLTLVKRLVEMHGGSVSAHSEGPGRGSEFIVRLPVVPGEQPAQAQAPQSTRPLTTHRILVVDDNQDGAESLATLLALNGHEVRTAHDGPTGLATAEEFRPDVILLDIGLPGMSGYEVANQLRKRPEFRTTWLIALTGWGQDADREQSRQAGFDLHLVKPIDPTELRRVLGTVPSPDQS